MTIFVLVASQWAAPYGFASPVRGERDGACCCKASQCACGCRKRTESDESKAKAPGSCTCGRDTAPPPRVPICAAVLERELAGITAVAEEPTRVGMTVRSIGQGKSPPSALSILTTIKLLI